jgi:hypothetical protein
VCRRPADPCCTALPWLRLAAAKKFTQARPGRSALARYLVELVHELDCDVVDPPGEQ